MCRHGCQVDDFSTDIFETAREAAPTMSCQVVSENDWEAVMFTIEELATIPLFSALGEKELEYLAGSVEDIHLSPGST